MRKLFLVVWFFIYSLCFAGSDKDYCDFDKLEKKEIGGEKLIFLPNDKEPFTGKAIATHDNGEKKAEVNFKDGKPNGVALSWYENGLRLANIPYLNGLVNGLATKWYKSGQKYLEGYIVDQVQDGTNRMWYESGQIYSESTYVIGLPHKLLQFHENGNKRKEGYYDPITDEINGTSWYENGQKAEVILKKGEYVKKYLKWLPNGFECPDTYLDNGNGYTSDYNEDGTLKERLWFTGGKIFSQNGLQRKNQILGMYIDLFRLPIPPRIFEASLIENTKVETTERKNLFSEKIGEKLVYYLDEQKKVPFTGKSLVYYPSGRLQSMFHHAVGVKHGLSTVWYPSGNKKSEFYFLDGMKNGPGIVWRENGTKKSEFHFSQDRLNGKGIVWRPNGNKVVEKSYMNGVLHGLSIGYDVKGKEISRSNYKDGKKNDSP